MTVEELKHSHYLRRIAWILLDSEEMSFSEQWKQGNTCSGSQ